MKTFNRFAFHLPHLQYLSAVLPLSRSLCLQRQVAERCRMPGAPIARLLRS